MMNACKRVLAWAFVAVLLVASIPAMAIAQTNESVQPLQSGYIFTACNAPAGGFAIRAGDNDGATELGRLYNGNVGRIYATWQNEPSIAFGWATGYGRETSGRVVHGYFKMAITCPQ